jgi:hypothetical protein
LSQFLLGKNSAISYAEQNYSRKTVTLYEMLKLIKVNLLIILLFIFVTTSCENDSMVDFYPIFSNRFYPIDSSNYQLIGNEIYLTHVKDLNGMVENVDLTLATNKDELNESSNL